MPKKRRICLQTYFLVTVLFLSGFTSLRAKISGSGHDFSASGWSGGEICIVCHTPHNADMTVVNSPLWNHQVTASTFTLYSSPTMDSLPEQPGQVSRLCLSCHDGTVALDSFGGSVGSTFISGSMNLTTDLSDDHPISITFDHSTIIGGPPGHCGKCHSNGPGFKRVIPFYNGKIECATCHEPHNDTAEEKMLRMTRLGSAICLHCHTNK